MGFLEAKAAAAKAQARRKAVGSFSGAGAARPAGGPLKRTGEAPIGRERGPLEASGAAVVVAEIGLELRLIARWPEDLRNEWEERAAILEYDAGLPRLVAERRAYRMVRDANGPALLMAEGGQ